MFVFLCLYLTGQELQDPRKKPDASLLDVLGLIKKDSLPSSQFYLHLLYPFPLHYLFLLYKKIQIQLPPLEILLISELGYGKCL